MTHFTRIELQALLNDAKEERSRLDDTHRTFIQEYRSRRDYLKTSIQQIEVELRKIDKEERKGRNMRIYEEG